MAKKVVSESTRQIIKTIQNKIPLNKGIVRRSLEIAPGFVSALHNFEIKNGETLTVRDGTRVLNSMEDQQFYFVDSFKLSNMTLTLGLNYKRELWGWLDKWPETDFKICDTSPFKKYAHRDSDSVRFYDNHFSFTKGNKFFVGEDDFSIIIINDYAEIFRIMKVGSIRITTDADVVDQESSIEDARDIDLITGRIWLDIKEATNKVFDNKMFIGDEYIRNSYRITGDTRFAYVNELGVISELSDPINMEEYRHVVASYFPVVPYNPKNKEVTLERVIRYGSVKQNYTKIFESTSTGWVEASLTPSDKWEPALPCSVNQGASSYMLAVKSGYHIVGTVKTEIPEGVYLSTCMRTGLIDSVPVKYTINSYNYNAIKLDAVDISTDKFVTANRVLRSRIFVPSYFTALPLVPGLIKVLTDEDDFLNYTTAVTFEDKQVEFDSTVINFVFAKDGYSKGYVRLSDVFDGDIYSQKQVTISNGVHTICFIGELLETKHSVLSVPDPALVYWEKSMLRAVESKSTLFAKLWTFWKNTGYDCWEYNGVAEDLSPTNIDPNRQIAVYNGIAEDTDVILSSEDLDSISDVMKTSHRFALWNDSFVMGTSQRDIGFGYFNLTDYLRVICPPLMTLDYTGLRRIPMPLPLIRRAMRNPQHIVITGSNVYSVEDNKIWVGDVNDFMMIDEIELHSAIYDVQAFGSGIIASTKNGLFLVERGSGVKRVVDGERIIPQFMSACSGGVMVVEDQKIYIAYRKVTDSGSWYPALVQINTQIEEANFEGKLKSVSIGDIIYLADEYTVWLYDTKKSIWCGQYVYGENAEKIQRLFVSNGKLGVIFETGIDREKSFDAPDSNIT